MYVGAIESDHRPTGAGVRAKEQSQRQLCMLARLKATIVPPAPEYVPKNNPFSDNVFATNSNDDEKKASNAKGLELSLVVAPSSDGADVPKLTSDYVSVALDMAVAAPKDSDEREDSERILSDVDDDARHHGRLRSIASSIRRRLVWSIAKIDAKTATLRPILLKGAKKIVSTIVREFERQFPPIETYVMENVLMRRAMEQEEEHAILNPEARRMFEESLKLTPGAAGGEKRDEKENAAARKDAEKRDEKENAAARKDAEEDSEEMILEAPAVVVTSRKKVRNKRSWLRESAAMEEEASTSGSTLSSSPSQPRDKIDADIEPPSTPPQKEEEVIQLPPQKELAAITKAKLRLREEEEKAKRNALLNSQHSNSKPLNFAPGWKKDVEVGDGTNAAVILAASKSDVKSRKIRQPAPMKQSNRKMTDMFGGSSSSGNTISTMKGTPSPPGKSKKTKRGSAKKKVSPPKSAKKRRQFEERRLAALFDEEKENKSRLEYNYYCSAGDTDIYVEAVVKPIKGKAL